jgi:hypothetical protein
MPGLAPSALAIDFFELGLCVLLAAIFLAFPRFNHIFSAHRWALRLGRTKIKAAAIVAAATLASAMITSVIRPPLPEIHDEFCYLLTADTFASGRATNPTHPLWHHFETFHTLHEPTYQSKYPPGQGLFLAAGQLLTGHPIVGVWGSMVLASVALFWCLSGWLPVRWALLGALFPCIRFGSADLWESIYWMYWSASFWGGGLALLGAALITGALPRLSRGQRTKDAVLLGIGLDLLAVSRPMEGLLASCVVAAFLFWAMARRLAISELLRALLPAALVVSLAACLLGFYHWRVSGSPFTFPYAIYTQNYDVAPLFSFLDLAPELSYRHQVMSDFHSGFMVDTYRAQRGGLKLSPTEWVFTGRFFVGPAFGIITLLGFWWRARWGLFCSMMMVFAGVAHQISSSDPYQPHYFAPFVPALLLLTVRGLRRLRLLKIRDIPIGRAICDGALVTSVAIYFLGASLRYAQRADVETFGVQRNQIQERLSQRDPKQLVIVRYNEHHNVHEEWVFNRADIDGSKVIWAREMQPENNSRLLSYFDDREVWLLEPDLDADRLTPYPR